MEQLVVAAVVVIHQTPGGEDDDGINMAGLDAGRLLGFRNP
jgi:hypothetical protein